MIVLSDSIVTEWIQWDSFIYILGKIDVCNIIKKLFPLNRLLRWSPVTWRAKEYGINLHCQHEQIICYRHPCRGRRKMVIHLHMTWHTSKIKNLGNSHHTSSDSSFLPGISIHHSSQKAWLVSQVPKSHDISHPIPPYFEVNRVCDWGLVLTTLVNLQHLDPKHAPFLQDPIPTSVLPFPTLH